MKINFNSQINYKANKMPYKQAAFLKDSLLNSKKVDIFCHDSTDKDSANCAVVMAQFLEAKGVNSRIILSQDIKALNLIAFDSSGTNCKSNSQGIEIIQEKDFEDNQPDDNRTVLCVDFNTDEKVSPKVARYIKNSKNIYGIDHHSNIDIVKGNYTYITKPLDDIPSIESVSSYYVDTSAKSATAIIYRFFETLGEDISNLQAYELFSGLVSDCAKGLIKCDGNRGTIELSEKFKEDKNTYEIYLRLKEKLTTNQIQEIAKSVDLISNLTPQEKEFKDSLKDKLVLSKNKKLAYLEIPQDDETWKNLGEDNPTTSTILNRFRLDVLNNTFNDDKLNDVQAILVFYKSGDNYRISAHSKQDSLLDFFNHAQKKLKTNKILETIPQSMGGHSKRGGGKIVSNNKYICHYWVKDIVSCEDFYD